MSFFSFEDLRGTNAAIEAALDEVFCGHFECGGVQYSALPNGDLHVALIAYLQEMDACHD